MLFKLFFFSFNLLYSLLYLWGLFLPTRLYRKGLIPYFKGIYWIEKYSAGLDYSLTGTDNIPQKNGYIIAAKHQSAYETFKLFLLFPNVVFILKKELLSVPIWGWHAKKMGCIPIDRTDPRASLKSLKTAVKQAVSNGFNIVIFPQGTRVLPSETTQDVPYKAGITKLYSYAQAPVLPVALNSGYFWPKGSYTPRSGKVTFSCLPIIPPGLSTTEFNTILEQRIETACQTLPHPLELSHDRPGKK